MTVVLDASALLAYLREEPGAEVVDGLLADARMASVNWAEVVQTSLAAGVDVEGMQEDLQALGLRLGLTVVPFGGGQTEKQVQLITDF